MAQPSKQVFLNLFISVIVFLITKCGCQDSEDVNYVDLKEYDEIKARELEYQNTVEVESLPTEYDSGYIDVNDSVVLKVLTRKPRSYNYSSIYPQLPTTPVPGSSNGYNSNPYPNPGQSHSGYDTKSFNSNYRSSSPYPQPYSNGNSGAYQGFNQQNSNHNNPSPYFYPGQGYPGNLNQNYNTSHQPYQQYNNYPNHNNVSHQGYPTKGNHNSNWQSTTITTPSSYNIPFNSLNTTLPNNWHGGSAYKSTTPVSNFNSGRPGYYNNMTQITPYSHNGYPSYPGSNSTKGNQNYWQSTTPNTHNNPYNSHNWNGRDYKSTTPNPGYNPGYSNPTYPHNNYPGYPNSNSDLTSTTPYPNNNYSGYNHNDFTNAGPKLAPFPSQPTNHNSPYSNNNGQGNNNNQYNPRDFDPQRFSY